MYNMCTYTYIKHTDIHYIHLYVGSKGEKRKLRIKKKVERREGGNEKKYRMGKKIRG